MLWRWDEEPEDRIRGSREAKSWRRAALTSGFWDTPMTSNPSPGPLASFKRDMTVWLEETRWLNLDKTSQNDHSHKCASHKPEGKSQKGVLVRKNVEERREHGIEAIKGSNGGLLTGCHTTTKGILGFMLKVTHHLQYPPGTTYLKAYFESRGGKFEGTIFYGLQYILKKHLSRKITQAHIDEAEVLFAEHFRNKSVFNKAGWQYIVDHLNGFIPVRIKAAPEGTFVPVNNVLFTVESTDEKVPWVVSYVETILVQFWYPLTVATNSFMQKKIIKASLERTADNLLMLDFKLHDFGFRGVTCYEAGQLGGSAHLVNFKGTDTLAAIPFIRKYYGPSEEIPAYSIPATEHSTMTAWTQEGELDAAKHILEVLSETPMSMVSDSYNLWHFLEQLGERKDLRALITQRSVPLVIRPDSGEPTEIVPKVLNQLGSLFGSKLNQKGFKVLPNYLRVIQGDGISYDSLQGILAAVEEAGWSTENMTFGSGGGLLQKVNRDTQKCAYKTCLAIIGGKSVDVFKDPITDPGKKSKTGDLTLVSENGKLSTIAINQMKPSMLEILVPVFENGTLLKEYNFDEIRRRAGESL
eukprot:maker-scaffold784_size97500-snap-gene-0.25 protein:Tk02996 transcript:maker-scaffold784_size97500-snap-gene-0.25-mRNA-1 annotation:"hypothetical protein BRAFLDRAFT_121174"